MLSFVERGSGPALVFLHAFPLDHTMWNEQIAFFSARYRVIAPDVFGFGGSQPPQPWTIPDMGAAVLDLLNHLEVNRCTLLGLSMGGYIAIPFALANQSRVERLVLAHTRARADTDAERTNRNAMIQTLQADGIAALPPKIVPKLLGTSAPDRLRQWLTDFVLRVSPEASVHAVAAMRDRIDRIAESKNIPVPALVIAGPEDAIIPVEDCRTMAERLPSGELAIVPGTGHLSNLENPEAFNQTVEAFLRRTDSR